MIPLLAVTAGLKRAALQKGGVQSGVRRLDGVSTHFLHVAGTAGGPPVLLVHGIADSSLTWASVIGPLASIGPVYAIDLAGFGLSGTPGGRYYATFAEQAQLLQRFVEDVIGQPPLMVGNSLGGWLAAHLAVNEPATVAGVVMLNPGGALLGGRAAWQPFVDTVAVPDLRTVRRIYKQMFSFGFRLPLYLDQRGFQGLFVRRPVREFVAVASEEDFLDANELRSIRVPNGMIWGTADHFLPPGSFEFFRDNMPNLELLELPGCGHLPQQEQPGAVVRFVQQFATRVGRRLTIDD